MPIALIGVIAVAALIYMLADRIAVHSEFMQRVDLIKQGKKPPGSPPTFPEAISSTAMWLALGVAAVAAVVIVPQLKKH